MDIRAILHHIQQGVSDRRTAQELRVNRRTVQQYRKWATEQGLLTGPLPPPEELQALLNQTLAEKLAPQNQSTVAKYTEQITKMHKEGVETAAICARLQTRGIPWLQIRGAVRGSPQLLMIDKASTCGRQKRPFAASICSTDAIHQKLGRTS